ncbi:MAG TPA: flagellar hook capping FlgD N-terminal domain-containing protein [Clostridiales bacterium]|nr:flagellar hook capping FlgD N-terminal domain-containing protein [Clostridiales bacterium]
MQINAYGATAGTTSSTGATSKSTLDTQDFLNLLVAQLTNQDTMNPTSDTEFISQMAQFTTLETMQTMTEMIYAQYGASMVGKNVIVAAYDNNGNYSQDQGVVQSVQFMDGDCKVTVNDRSYSMSSIMEVLNELPASE